MSIRKYEATTRRTGLVRGMPADVYHAGPELSATKIKRLNESPATYRWYEDHPEPPTDSMAFGTLAHTLLLEPEKAGNILGRDWDHRSKAGLARTADLEDNGYWVVTRKELDDATNLVAAVRGNRDASRLLGRGYNEISGFATLAGRRFRVRFDYLPIRNGGYFKYFVDLKTATTSMFDNLERAAAKYGWHIQAAIYHDMLELLTGSTPAPVWVVVESSAPYRVAVLDLTYLLPDGRDTYHAALDVLAACRRRRRWPAGRDGLQALYLPKYHTQPLTAADYFGSAA